MEDDTIPAEIAMTAIDCKEFFDTQAPTDHEWIRSAQFEFNYWFNTFIATQFDKSGLDYLLRHYPDKRENICDLIDALKSAVEGAMHIYNGTGKLLTSKINSAANCVTQNTRIRRRHIERRHVGRVDNLCRSEVDGI